MTRKLKSILIPNILQFVILLVLLFVGTLVAIPAIENVFEQVGSEDQLPATTLWFKGVLQNLMQFWYIPTFIVVAIVVSIYFYVRTPHGKYNYHYFKYKMPIFGPLIYAIDFSRLIRAVLLNIKNGMRVQDALETSKTICNNLVMLSLIESSINNILIGQSWIEPFEQSGLSTPMITEMLKIGMQSDLAEMMEKLLEYMDIDIDNIMTKIMKVLPQVVYIIVGILLIFVTIVVLVPLIQVYMGTWLFSAYL
ncbi:MAG: type II secretion system F family protein [Clostridia bacterium]|nr:type II secretion system F family protein [Clostridia bacterium]